MVIDLAALSSNLYIYWGLIMYCDLISRLWQTVSTNSLLIKPYLVAQVSTKVIALILFSSVYCIVKKLLQKRFFSIKNEEIIRLLFLSLKGASLFLDQCS